MDDTPNNESQNNQEDQKLEPKEERFGSRAGFVAPKNDEQRWWDSCFHSRWTKIDRTRFKDRIVLLKECRKCGKKKSEVIYRDMNARNVYTATDVFAVPKVVTNTQESDS